MWAEEIFPLKNGEFVSGKQVCFFDKTISYNQYFPDSPCLSSQQARSKGFIENFLKTCCEIYFID